MAKLTTEAKEALVHQVLNRGEETIDSIASRNNVGYSSLQKWVKRFREEGSLRRKKVHPTKGVLSSKERFNHLLATHALDEVSLGKYCREQGIYNHQLNQWREAFMNEKQGNNKLRYEAELKQLKLENKRLNQELRRKEKALAEASALLIMKKKADLIWGESEVV